jgi:hypothetical protein
MFNIGGFPVEEGMKVKDDSAKGISSGMQRDDQIRG